MPKKYIYIIPIILLIIGTVTYAGCNHFKKARQISSGTKEGTLTRNETWSGEILVTKPVIVPKGITLTIEPGTVIKFKHYRGLSRIDNGTVVLAVDGGTIKAIGEPDKQIWFTSDATQPINGDWAGIEIVNSQDSIFKYAIVEYANLGIAQFDSRVSIINSIVRWSNSEGLYAERSSPIIKNNTLYANGYHEIALEQYNKNAVIEDNIFGPGHAGIMVQNSIATIKGNYFNNYSIEAITVDGSSRAKITDNKFERIKFDPPIQIIYTGDLFSSSLSNIEKFEKIRQLNILEVNNNDYGQSKWLASISKSRKNNLQFDYQLTEKTRLNYIPGDSNDLYMYVYPSYDKTRKVIKKIGQGLGFGWSLCYANGYLWKFDTNYMRKIDPNTGNYTEIKYYAPTIDKPRGLAYDGEYFWSPDYGTLKINKFKVENNTIKVYDSFDLPDKEKGGVTGITTDGQYIYLVSRNNDKLYKLNKTGQVVGEIKSYDIGAPVWTGQYFWANGGKKGLQKVTKEGVVIGGIYPPAEGVFATAWDGKYLWTLQRTSEMWDDAKIFQVEILDDSL